MRHLVISLAVSSALLVPASVLACGAHASAQSTMAQVQKVDEPAPAAPAVCDHSKMVLHDLSADQLASLQKENKVRVYDANTQETRQKLGVIPGAILLTSTQYDPAKELPAAKDANLVFYCYSEQCRSSRQAAMRAIEAGYTQVSLFPAGITGWQKAGFKTVKPALKQS